MRTYASLSADARSVTGRLDARPGVVGVLTTRTPASIAAILGIWSAGGAYCPVDPAFPIERQRAMLAAVGCRTVLATKPEQPTLPGIRVLDISDLNAPESGPSRVAAYSVAPTATGPADRDRPGTDPSSPAYTLFTSGSTGVPKPVVTPRGAFAATVRSLRELFGITPADRVLQFASLNWDTCFEEILPTLTAGATLVFHDEAYSGSFPRFLRMVERERVTVLDLPTAFWHELVHHLTEDRIALPECVRLMVIGGEAVNPARLADWRDLDTGRVRLVNTYGCTETTLITHAVDLHGPRAAGRAAESSGRVPIGSALPHVREDVADDGELLIGGPALALGYHDLPDATAARFLDRGDGRFFRTGDRVTADVDGMLTHHGRLDNEVKIRGIRVDPAEVEAQIAGHPGVAAVAVAAVTQAGRTTLVAYVVAHPQADETLAADIAADLRTRVPGHLVPARISIVPQLVYTASGKVDRAGSHLRLAHDRNVPRPRHHGDQGALR